MTPTRKRGPILAKDKMPEARRLLTAFERAADEFYPTTFSVEYIQIDRMPDGRRFHKENHAIVLWQFYGVVSTTDSIERMLEDALNPSDLIGVRGSSLSCFGVIEGAETERFLRMASRAGALFSKQEAVAIKSRLLDEIIDGAKTAKGQKPVGAVNDNPLAIWLNYLLYYLSITHPGRDRQKRISPDPFSLSLLALEQLVLDGELGKLDDTAGAVAGAQYAVALSYSGNHRTYVGQIAAWLGERWGTDSVFYDKNRESLLARPNLDVLLQSVFRHQSRLCVVFVSSCYLERDWCQAEWRAMRDLLKSQLSERLMIVRLDDSSLEGMLGIDGYLDARGHSVQEVMEAIHARITHISA